MNTLPVAAVVEHGDRVTIVPFELTHELIDAAAAVAIAESRQTRPISDSAVSLFGPRHHEKSVVAINDRRRQTVERKWDELRELVSIELTSRDDARALIMSLIAAADHVWPVSEAAS